MDKEWIEQQFRDHALFRGNGNWSVRELELDFICEAIAQAHEEDKNDALETLGNAWADIEDGHIAELEKLRAANETLMDKMVVRLNPTPGEALHMAESHEKIETENKTLRAKMAMMAGLMAEERRWAYSNLADEAEKPGTLTEEDMGYMKAIITLTNRAAAVLQSAPVVLYSGRVVVENLIGNTRLRLDALFDSWVDGQTHEVIVLECQPKGGHPEKSEQGYGVARGAVPWKEGDELPEDTIARLRGRESEQTGP